MTIKQFLDAAELDEILISHDGVTTRIGRNNQLLVEAFGYYIIDKLRFYTEGELVCCEITLKTTFLKRGVA